MLKEEKLVENAAVVGEYLMDKIKGLPGVIEVRGKGLMIGVDMDIHTRYSVAACWQITRIVTGYSGKNTLRLLPPLCMGKEEADYFVERLTYN